MLVVGLTGGCGPASSRPMGDSKVRAGTGILCFAARTPSKNININAIRITITAMIDKTETYIKNAPVLPRSRIPEKTKMKLCMSLERSRLDATIVRVGERTFERFSGSY
jgi:hypothetical protein